MTSEDRTLTPRRRFIITISALLLAASVCNAANFTEGREIAPFPTELEAGE